MVIDFHVEDVFLW